MCGIAGFFSYTNACDMSRQLMDMATSIQHRGPDDEGYVFANIDTDEVNVYSSSRSPSSVQRRWPTLSLPGVSPHHIGLSHVRYSIMDLSYRGHQPMHSKCGRACLTFNGEIYNYFELRRELELLGYVFSSRSDTEVLLNGYLAWGEQVFLRLNGFFAVAIYDHDKKGVLLARDRLGKAHLYFSHTRNKLFLWASEIKSLLATRCLHSANIDPIAISDFVLFGRRDHAGTFWRDVEDFPPGHYAWLDREGIWNPKRYWTIPNHRLHTSALSPEDATTGLLDILTDALQIRLRADVPIAFELSGGMDSSALVSLAAGRLGKKITTYTIAFAAQHCNEEPFARTVATRYPDKIDYHVINHDKDHFWQTADQFIWLQEEPFHSPNLQTNQHLRKLLKHEGVHVVITGAAGDEMLAGYASEYSVPFMRHLLNQLEFKRFFQEIKSNTEITPNQILMGITKDLFLPEGVRTRLSRWRSGELHLLTQVLSKELMRIPTRILSDLDEKSFHGRTIANMTYRLMNYWLRSSMKANYGIPIEARSPFLDYRVVELCCQLPPEYLIYNGWQKHVLRMAVKDYLPEEVLWRRQKMGFPFPLREWLLESQSVIYENLRDIDCPHVNSNNLLGQYEEFIKIAPITLWRLVSVLLWWRRLIENKSIIES